MPKTLEQWWNEAETSDDTDILLYSKQEFEKLRISKQYQKCSKCGELTRQSANKVKEDE